MEKAAQNAAKANRLLTPAAPVLLYLHPHFGASHGSWQRQEQPATVPARNTQAIRASANRRTTVSDMGTLLEIGDAGRV